MHANTKQSSLSGWWLITPLVWYNRILSTFSHSYSFGSSASITVMGVKFKVEYIYSHIITYTVAVMNTCKIIDTYIIASNLCIVGGYHILIDCRVYKSRRLWLTPFSLIHSIHGYSCSNASVKNTSYCDLAYLHQRCYRNWEKESNQRWWSFY